MENIKTKIIAFDLDGTLLTSKKVISDRSLETIIKLYEKGHEIVIATARPMGTIEKYISTIGLPISLIVQNGAAYSINTTDFVINYIDNKLFTEIVEYLIVNDSACAISIMDNDQWYSISEFDYKGYYKVEISPQKMSVDNFLQKNCTKILVNNCKMKNQLYVKYKDILNVIETDNHTLLQIMSKKASKEYALEKILEEKRISNSKLICFGDDHNDLGMFDYSGYSIAMGNSVKKLKDIANFITDTNDNEGIYKFFNSDKWEEIEKT